MIDIACEQIITLEEAALRLKVSVATVRGWANRGRRKQLETIKLGGTRRTSVEALQRFAEQSGSPTQSPTPERAEDSPAYRAAMASFQKPKTDPTKSAAHIAAMASFLNKPKKRRP